VALTEASVRELASFKGTQAPVTSCYLNVDGSRLVRRKDLELHLDAVLRRRRERLQSDGDRSSSVDLRRIEDHIKSGFDRSGVRGLALFSCAAHDLWRVFELPVPVRDQLIVAERPHVRQLESVLDQYQRFGVLLVDRQRARMFLFELGKLVEKSELFDQLPRHDDDRGDLSKDQVRGHVEVAARHHLRRAAQVAFQVLQEQGFDHLIIGAPEELTGELERELHSYLRARIAAWINIAIGASDDEIRQTALEVEAAIERAREADMVRRLRDAIGSRTGGVAGLADVLAALVERRVDTLFVSEGFESPGWRCRSCRYMGLRGRNCPVCPSRMERVDDIVEEAVEEALNQSCRVETCRSNADLDVAGRIGALLRYPRV
jgi:peptide chain release factor subunit 1